MMSRRGFILKKLIQSSIFSRMIAMVTGKSYSEAAQFTSRLFLPRYEVDYLGVAIAALAAQKKSNLRSLNIIQVGANDGVTGDPIHKYILKYAQRALLIEPQQWLIEDLRNAYKDFMGELIIETIAISSHGGEVELHILDEDLWPEYISKVGRHPSAIFSGDRDQVMKRVKPRLGLSDKDAQKAVKTVLVYSAPLSEVIEKHGFSGVDLLQIDCEGWDFKVIESLGPYRPSIINFESFNLSAADWEGFQQWARLEDYGYIRGSADTLAIKGLDGVFL